MTSKKLVQGKQCYKIYFCNSCYNFKVLWFLLNFVCLVSIAYNSNQSSSDHSSLSKKCLTAKFKVGNTFRIFITKIPIKYCQKGIEKYIFLFEQTFKILKQKAILREIKKMTFAAKRAIAFKSLENDLLYLFFKSTKFYSSKNNSSGTACRMKNAPFYQL